VSEVRGLRTTKWSPASPLEVTPSDRAAGVRSARPGRSSRAMKLSGCVCHSYGAKVWSGLKRDEG
jgi:hypothetical protein